MRALIDDLRHNPDIVAVLALSLALGIARQCVPDAAATWVDPPGMRIHRVMSRPARAVNILGSRFAILSERMQRRIHRSPQAFFPPEVHR